VCADGQAEEQQKREAEAAAAAAAEAAALALQLEYEASLPADVKDKVAAALEREVVRFGSSCLGRMWQCGRRADVVLGLVLLRRPT
jgi:hypothetical protein